ncbi:MAG TPA: porin family protein [Chitinivibrionales bacterium]|nr:porin family protein [Chitinivibrionales bacterium]
MITFCRLAMCAALIAFAPLPSHSADFYAGVKGGLGLAGLWGADAGDTASMTGSLRAGFCGGAMGAVLFTANIGVQAEVLYAQKGKTSSGDNAGTSFQEEWKSDYVEVPVVCRLSYPLKMSRVLGYAGPSFSYLLSSSYTKSTQSDVSGNSTAVTDTRESTSAFDVGLALGGGMEFDIRTGEIIFDLRFTPGFITTDGRDNVRRLDTKNYLITFLIGYAFKF